MENYSSLIVLIPTILAVVVMFFITRSNEKESKNKEKELFDKVGESILYKPDDRIPFEDRVLFEGCYSDSIIALCIDGTTHQYEVKPETIININYNAVSVDEVDYINNRVKLTIIRTIVRG